MALKINIPQFDEDIHLCDAWTTRGVGDRKNRVFGSVPVKFNCYDKVFAYRGTSDYNSGWVSILNLTAGLQLFYRITYTAATDIGWFDIAIYSEGVYNGIALKFDFTLGVNEDEKYIYFALLRSAFTNPDNMVQPSGYQFAVSQWAGETGIGVWDNTQKRYNYTRNHVEISAGDFYNAAGPWLPVFPQTSQSVENPDLFSGVIFMPVPNLVYATDHVYADYGFESFFGDTWDPYTEITNSNGQPAEPGSYDPNDNDPDGPSGPGGGDGDHRQPHDPVPIPPLPTVGPNSAGFVYMLSLTVAQMQNFAADLINPTMWQAFKDLFADPMDFMCGVMLVPYTPTSTQNVYPKYGQNVFTHSYPQVFNQYVEINCGSLDITKYFGSCFDYNPYTELLVWLPYIGYRKLDTDNCQGRTVTITYHCDCMTGDCVAYILVSGNNLPNARVIAQYSGNCGVRVPYGANSYDAAVAASIQLLGGAVGAIAGGAMAGPTGIAAGEISASQIANSIQGSTVAAVMASKTISERAGVAGASAGYLSVQKPYLLRAIPRQSLPANYADIEGYPSNIAGPLSKCSGFAAVETIDLNGIAATSEEIEEIRTLLKGGVFI